MQSMFYHYDNNITADLCKPCTNKPPIPLRGVANAEIIYNRLGEPKGIKLLQNVPIDLYLDLCYPSESYEDLKELEAQLTSSRVLLTVSTISHKTIFSQAFNTAEVLDFSKLELKLPLDFSGTSPDLYRLNIWLEWSQDASEPQRHILVSDSVCKLLLV